MTTVLDVDGRQFTMSPTVEATKYDEWTFYRQKFMKLEAKAVDILALRQVHLFLIEVEDYTHVEMARIPLESLPGRVAEKCRDSLGGLAAARFLADDSQEKAFAGRAMCVSTVSITLHIELPLMRRGRLHDPRMVMANLQTKLRTAVKVIDPHARVEDHTASHGNWTSQRL